MAVMLVCVWTSVDYELDWPPELLRSELHALRHHPYRPGSSFEITHLLSEAFHTDVPASEYNRFCSAGEWAGDPGPGRAWVDDLLAHVDELRPFAPRPYWTERRARPSDSTPADTTTPAEKFSRLIEQFQQDGYLARNHPEPCVDDPEQTGGEDLNTALRMRLGVTGEALWPLRPDTWDDETFYSLIEIFTIWSHVPESSGNTSSATAASTSRTSTPTLAAVFTAL